MGQIDKLNQRGNAFSLVLNDSGANLFKSSSAIYNRLGVSDLDFCFIAVMYHDKDYDTENHRYKTPHYHVVLTFDNTYRVGTILNCFVDIFHCNENQITIEKCSSVPMQTRYLIHLDDLDKYQYNREDIVSNHVDVVARYLNLNKIIDLNDCVVVVRNYHYDLESIMCNVLNFDKWRRNILDLINNHFRYR